MRSSSTLLIAFGLFLASMSVEAIIRPGYGSGGHRPPSSYHGGHHNDDDCTTKPPKSTSTPSTSTSTPTTTTTTPTTTTTTTTTTTPEPTTTKVKVCPQGYTSFLRTPAADNSFTSEWCMQLIWSPRQPMPINNASALCQASNTEAVVTTFANEEELNVFSLQMAQQFDRVGPATRGAIAVDGRRIAACVSRDRGILDSEECNGTNSFVMVDKHTSPGFTWSKWATNEPSANAWTYDIEQCIQFTVYPALTGPGDNPYNMLNRNNKFNDIYCNMDKAPNEPTNTAYWNFGALCGVLPS